MPVSLADIMSVLPQLGGRGGDIPVSADVALESCVGGRPCPEALNQKIKDEAKSFYFQFKEFVPRG